MAGLEEFLDHMTGLPDLWNPTGAECARHWTATYPAAATPRARAQHLEGLSRQPQLSAAGKKSGATVTGGSAMIREAGVRRLAT